MGTWVKGDCVFVLGALGLLDAKKKRVLERGQPVSTNGIPDPRCRLQSDIDNCPEALIGKLLCY